MDTNKTTCGICGAEVEELQLIFIETDWGLCPDCAREVENDIKTEMGGKHEEAPKEIY